MSVFSVLHFAGPVAHGETAQCCQRCGSVLQEGSHIAAWPEGTPVVLTFAGGQAQAVPYEGLPRVFFDECAPAARFGDSGGPVVALEPSTEPEHPLRSQDVQPLIPKVIG